MAGNTTDFTVTSYEYYTKSSANSSFGCNVEGLLKSVTNPEGNTTTYTYNSNGDTSSVTDAAGNTTTYTYDSIGQKLSETTSTGDTFSWNYDKNGMVIREIHPDGGVKRTIYDPAEYTLLEVNPEQYKPAQDNLANGIYSGTAGTKYEWYDNGYQKALTDAAGNRTEYTWDIFGNKQTEKKPNGSIYRYEYDVLKRPTKTYFKENATAPEVLLSEANYWVLMDCNTQTTITSYADSSQKSTVTTIKDYAGREVEVQYGSYSRVRTAYNKDGTMKLSVAANGAITYHQYDALGNLTGTYKPMSVEEGITKYSWTGYTYDKAGRVTEQRTGKSLVTYDPENPSNPAPSDSYVKQYLYEDTYIAEETDSDGRRTAYTYDGRGRVIRKEDAVSAGETLVTENTYNYLDLPLSITRKVRAGDIAGNNYSDDSEIDVKESSEYDLNGNLVRSVDAAGNTTTYTYDALNRILTTSRMLKDASGKPVSEAVTSRTYTWDGLPASETDAMGNTTTYSYDARGNQIKVTDALRNTSYTVYDRMGRKTASISPKNYQEGAALKDMERTEYQYDELGRVTMQTEIYQKMTRTAAGSWTREWVQIAANTYEYDTLGNITKTTDALGNSTETDYNLAGMPEYVTDAETAYRGIPYTVKYTYNGLGQKTGEIYDGEIYRFSYDGAGNLLRTEINGITKSTVTYDLIGRVLSSTDGLGNTSYQEWNALNKNSEVRTPGDSTIDSYRTTYQYDVKGNLIKKTDSLGVVTTYSYDSFGRNLSIKVTGDSGEASVTSHMSYDLNGNVLSRTDGNGNTTSMTYDALNRKLTVTNALGQISAYTYDANGNTLSETNHLGNSTRMMYDGINRMVEQRDALNNIVKQLHYNDANAQTSSFDALHNETGFLYDRNLRQTGTVDGEGNTSYVAYDSRGNVRTRTDANGNVTSYRYDGENRLTSVTDALGNRTSYVYDNNGNMISQTDGNVNTTTFRYNAAKLLVAKIDPQGEGDASKTERYTYFANGKMASKTDRNGVTTTYTYDSLGRLLSEDAGGDIQSYTYDANGNLLTMTDSTGTTFRTYDALNRNISKTIPELGTSTYEYDLPADEAGEYCERTTDPKGNVTLNTYDKAGRLSRVTVGDDTTQYSYYRNGRRYRITYPDGTMETYVYDKKNQIINLINAGKNGATISSYQYTYDPDGNQLTKTEAKGTTSYAYDSLNRLSKVTEPGGKETSYTYDSTGNRKTEKIVSAGKAATIIYAYNKQNRLTKTLSTSGAETIYFYDNNGNLISKSAGISALATIGEGTGTSLPNFGLIIRKDQESGTGSKDLTLYTYDRYNRLTGTKSENTRAAYRYNAQGYRVEKTSNGETTRYLYEYDKVVLETDGSNREKTFQVYGSGTLLYRSVEAGIGTEAQDYYYLYNAHGDVTGLVDAEGSIAATYDYDAFGNIIVETGTTSNSIKYAGYQHDKESGLYYLNARYYDSTTARFITEDTYRGKANDPLSLNLYTYCQNNPIKYVDPSGHKNETEGSGKSATDPDFITVTKDGMLISIENSKYRAFSKNGWSQYNGEMLEFNTISILGNVNSVSTGTSTRTVFNYGNVESLHMYSNDKSTIKNQGNIGSVFIGSKSTTQLLNTGYINSINISNNSGTYIENSGSIDSIHSGNKSALVFDNTGYIDSIHSGKKNIMAFANVGNIGYIDAGKKSKIMVNTPKTDPSYGITANSFVMDVEGPHVVVGKLEYGDTGGEHSNVAVGIGSVSMEMANTQADYKYGGGGIGAIKVEGVAEADLQEGIELGAMGSLVNADGYLKIPIPFTDYKIKIGVGGYAFGLGGELKLTYTEGIEFKAGLSALFGGSVTIGIVK